MAGTPKIDDNARMSFKQNYAKARTKNSRCALIDIETEDREYGEILLDAINKFIYYPNADIQSRIVASFLCQFTPILDKAFCMYTYGGSRSGKSTTGKLAAKLYGVELFASSSIAACRNWLEENCIETDDGIILLDVDGNPVDRNLVLCLEDVSESILLQPNLYQLLKISCDRETAISRMSGEKWGSNQNFNVFCLKLISSICQIHTNPKLEELSNRTIFIKCQRSDVLLPQLSKFNFNKLRRMFENAWTEEKVDMFCKLNDTVTPPSDFDLQKWELSQGMILSGYVLGVVDSLNDAYELFREYWAYRSECNREVVTPMDSAVAEVVSFYNSFPGVLPDYIRAEWLTQEMKARIRLGTVPVTRFDNAKMHESMINQGYTLSNGYWQVEE